MYLYPGTWKSFDDLEESITRQELAVMLEKGRELKREQYKFMAALKGIDLDKEQQASFDDVKRRAAAKVANTSEEQIELEGMIQVIEEDE